MKFRVEVYEPNVDPGGWQDTFEVEAENATKAAFAALDLAEERWPDNEGLVAGKCTPVS